MARMSKKNKEQLENYLGCNYGRRAILLARMGHKDQETYFKSIKHKPHRKPKMNVKADKNTPVAAGTVAGKAKTIRATAKVKDAPISKRTKKSCTKVDGPAGPAVDMVIAFDTTGSMSSYISQVRKHVEETVVDLFKSNDALRIKIVAFGDYCDMNGKDDFGKAYQLIELTNNVEALVDFVRNAQNTSGGDGDEFYELVIRKINRETEWREEATKVVLLIADSSPHKVGYSYGSVVRNNKISWRDEAQEAKKLGIAYDTLRIKEYSQWYKDLSKITGGASLPFKSSHKMEQVVKASTLRRSSSKAFAASYSKAVDSGDKELIGVYKTLDTL